LIVSTQRFSMLEIVDRIIVFEKGRVIADATKEEILKRMNNNG
jgi:ATP-binding cassette subfamily C protein LapB